ncbi:MAG: hypothetical protein L3J78_01500 [Thermoplasmata archaeon]|nr:hypothetical protein [Thermoplasmata archaeon]
MAGPTPLAPPPMPGANYPIAPGRRPPDATLVIVAVVVVMILVAVFFVLLFAGSVGGFMAFSLFPVLCVPFLIVIVFVVIAVAGGFRGRTIPPPPPIQQPMVPAGQQGPIALSCPNCGGPPTNVDRFGVATCSYCGTRYLVR